MTLTEWVKANAVLKEGVNISELEALEKDLDPLANIGTKEAAAEFIDRNGFFKSALDSAVSKAITSHDEKFNTEKLPEILKAETEKIRLELNPKETEAEKRLRLIEDELGNSKKLLAENALKDILRAKAKEIEFVGDPARYSVYGDKAIEYMQKDKELFDSQIESVKKDFYKDNPNPTQTKIDPDKTMTRADFTALSPQGQSDFIVKNSGVVVD